MGAPISPGPIKTSRGVASMDEMDGSIDLRGKEFKFDPLSLADTYSPFLPWFRECELRHARTAMLAVVGWVAADNFRLPGEQFSFETVPSSAQAHDILVAQGLQGPMSQLLIWIALFDLVVTMPAAAAAMKGERAPGDFGLYLAKPKDEAAYKSMVDKELLNGRLAMIAIGGIATQAVISGGGFPYV